MALSLKKLGRNIWETLTPQNEEALRAGQRSIQSANQQLMQRPAKYGVLAQPQARQKFVQSQQAPQFDLKRSALTSFADTLTQPERLAEAPKVNVGDFRGSGVLEDFINSPFKMAEGGVKVGQGRIKEGVGDIVTGGLEGPLGLVPIGRTAQAGTKAAGILPKVIAGAKAGLVEGAMSGGAYAAGQAASENATPGEIIKRGATGAAVGGAGGAVVGGTLPAVTAGAKYAASKRVPLNEVGAVGKNVSDDVPLSDLPGVGQARPGAEVQKAIENALNAGDKEGAQTLVNSITDPDLKAGMQSTLDAVSPPAVKPNPTVTAKEPKPRGFAENITRANASEGNLTADAVIEAMPGYKPISNRNTLGKAAKEVNADAQAAYARVATKPQLTSAQDVATGHLLLRQAVESGDVEAAIQIGTKLGIDGTKLGQAVQAYSMWKRTTPEGIVRYAGKQAGKAGRELDPAITTELIEAAKRIADMPESLEKAKATRELLGQANQLGRTWKDTVGEILSTPRAAMATADLSAPFRQGAVLGARFPKQWAKDAAQAVKFFASPGAYEQAMYEISQRPSYPLMRARKLAVDAVEELTGTEEEFLGNILESNVAKKLGVGQVVAASSRAYSGFLTKLRADVFDKIVTDANTAGVQLGNKELDSLVKFINSASGRGEGKLTSQVSKLQVFFSPRLWKSRLDVLNPGYYASLDPVARKYALGATAAFGSIVTTILGLAAAAGADVGLDPRSADFAKIKVGNTRWDILGGLQQNIRLAAQLATGEKINSETGEIQTLGPDRGFGKPSRLDLSLQFLENKLNPAVGYGAKVMRGTDPTGEPINPGTEAAKLFIPLTAQSTYETAKDQGSLGKGVAMNLPAIVGVGTQTYGSKPDEKSKPKVAAKGQKTVTNEGYSLEQGDDGKYAYKLAGDDTVHKAKDLASARLAIARDEFSKSDKKSKVIGDTYFYKKKDGKVATKPKAQHDWEQTDAKLNLGMDRAYEKGDLKTWLALASSKYDALEKKKGLYDPETEADEIDKITLQQENLQQKAGSYIEKGYVGKASGGGGGGGGKKGTATAGSPYKYAVASNAGGQAASPRVTVRASGGGGSKRARAAARPAVSLKRSKV